MVYIGDIKKATQEFRCYEDYNWGHLEYLFVMLRVDEINDDVKLIWNVAIKRYWGCLKNKFHAWIFWR
jgi:hypothetical protein